jgi:hypothetical protein
MIGFTCSLSLSVYFLKLVLLVLLSSRGINSFVRPLLSPTKRGFIATKEQRSKASSFTFVDGYGVIKLPFFAFSSLEEQYQNVKALTPLALDSEQATLLVNKTLFPPSERGARYKAGAKGQNIKPGEILSPDDPRLSLAYEEFPLHSFEILIDRADELRLENLARKPAIGATETTGLVPEAAQRIKLVDLGSGAGRLVIYGALVKGGAFGWDVHGIEILSELHFVAQEVLTRAIAQGIFIASAEQESANGSLHLHLGSAKICATRGILKDADIIFCYSTVLPAPDFCVEWGAPMLSFEWSELLSASCPKGCLVITTDRVLNPLHGWLLLDKMEVDNPVLCGSVGYIHLLDGKPFESN